MAGLSDDQRTEIISDLVENCACWEESDREVLDNFDDEKLQMLQLQFEEPDPTDNDDQDVGDGEDDGDGTFNMSELSDQELTVELTRRRAQAKKSATQNRSRGDMPDFKQPKQQTREEWLESAPPEIRSAVENAMELEKREKKQLIEQIVANADLSTDQFKRITTRLWSDDIASLRDQVSLMPKAPESRPPSYFGQAAAPSVNQLTTDEQDDVLGLPTINWEEAQKEMSAN